MSTFSFLDVSDYYVILTLAICGFAWHDLKFLIDSETGSRISIEAFRVGARIWQGFGELRRVGNAQNQCGDVQILPKGESYEVTRVYVCVLAVCS